MIQPVLCTVRRPRCLQKTPRPSLFKDRALLLESAFAGQRNVCMLLPHTHKLKTSLRTHRILKLLGGKVVLQPTARHKPLLLDMLRQWHTASNSYLHTTYLTDFAKSSPMSSSTRFNPSVLHLSIKPMTMLLFQLLLEVARLRFLNWRSAKLWKAMARDNSRLFTRHQPSRYVLSVCEIG